MKTSDLSEKLLGQEMFKILEKCDPIINYFHYEIGDQNFKPDNRIIKESIKSLENNETHYTSSEGLPELRDSIKTYTLEQYNMDISLDQISVITANTAIDFALRLLLNKSDEIIIFEPAFPTYFSSIKYNGFKFKSIQLKEHNGFKIDINDLQEAISSKTKVILINFPNNPTGATLTKNDLEKIYNLCKKNNIYLISDETYSRMYFDSNVKHNSVASFDHCKENVIVINSFSKNFAMAGWRLGYVLGPKSFIKKLNLMNQTILSCFPVFTQKAAIAALELDNEWVEQRNKKLQCRRDLLSNGINEIKGLSCAIPTASMYLFVNISNTNLNSKEFTNILLNNKILVTPGTAFGFSYNNYVRFSFGKTSCNQIKSTIDIMKKIFGVKNESI